MKVLFVGSNPSIKNDNLDIPFVGTRSQKILDIWVKFLELANYKVINILDRTTDNNRPLTKREIRNCIFEFKEKLKGIEYDRIIALGNSASTALKMLKLDHFKLSHPSPKNRKLNDQESIEKELKECKVFLYENK